MPSYVPLASWQHLLKCSYCKDIAHQKTEAGLTLGGKEWEIFSSGFAGRVDDPKFAGLQLRVDFIGGKPCGLSVLTYKLSKTHQALG